MDDKAQPQAPPPQESGGGAGRFFKHQLKLAFSTFTITTVATLSITFWINLSIIMLVVAIVGLAAASSSESGGSEASPPPRNYTTTYGNSDAKHKLLSIPVKGPIEGSKSSGGYEGIFAAEETTYGYDLKAELIEAANSGDYSGVILEIDSPGGTIYGAKAIADGVDYFKRTTGQPVYASVQGLAASGGYWSAASADKIIADNGTGIGSIGVIYGPFTYYDKPTALDGGILGGGVVTQNGIEQSYITAGEGKDAGNPFRRLTAKEQEVIQTAVNDNYDLFVDHVANHRKINPDTVRSQLGAHLYGEKQALSLKLIDQIGSREKAYYELAKKAGVAGSYRIVSSHEESGDFFSSLGSRLPFLSQPAKPNTTKNQALACTGSISIPLAFYGQPASACKKD